MVEQDADVNDHAVHNPSHPILYSIKTILSLSTPPLSRSAAKFAKHTTFEIYDASKTADWAQCMNI